MALTVALAPKLGTASCAVEGLGVRCRTFGAVRQRRVAVAVSAVVKPLAGVHPLVAPQVGHLHEPLVADGAAERLLARVQSYVRLEVMVASEAFVALRALVGLLAGMRSIVVLQHVLVVERLVAQIARVFLFGAGVARWLRRRRRRCALRVRFRRRRARRLESEARVAQRRQRPQCRRWCSRRRWREFSR